ncbi:MAG: hypothetical protein COU81_01185 [Candidatus Portnoybacteria bacterium CG10_big_fil_rev_8_21_14_0_10_36_7]|uniref:DUF8128 domain-containing protein n=1 Tax=Candidatus Portnoybacteria bacterium CG10_big_fil_rev_8_21_14_0_10_36_7 TaxID=1974812 RepID=A0A2M8KEL0_9BACT|nr:MAG: hypothetical protein COU81_01185 [Candidatus Portnoybacteria bacterium CG10_big_fil_rev_8_21_14_0_10_36_7]
MPPVLIIAFFKSWMYYIKRENFNKLEWVLLEIYPPSNLGNSPKIAEAIFSGLWAVVGTGSVKFDKYWKGQYPDYYSLELVGIDGVIHFFIRTQRKYRNVVEANIYAQYSAAEIKEVPDYVDEAVPAEAPSATWDLWGTVLRLSADQSYPIRTYQSFVDITSGAEETPQFLDPLSSLMEVLNKLKPGERVVIQILIRPVGDTWKEESQKVVDDLIGKPTAKKAGGVLVQELAGWANASRAVAHHTLTGEQLEFKEDQKNSAELPSKMLYLTPGQRDSVLAIENKLSKKAYETKIQFVYLARKDVYAGPTVSSVMGVFNQFSTLNLNGLRPNKLYTTTSRYLFAVQRAIFKKRTMVKLLRGRAFWEKGYILNIEELASLWHFPTSMVKAPATPKVLSKKGEPPVSLPIE